MKVRLRAMVMLLAGACHSGQTAGVPGDAGDTTPFHEIAADEVIRFAGTEPFWGGQVAGTSLTYTAPDNLDGSVITVERFAGRGGLSFSGRLDGRTFDLAITPGDCTDGMSDRTYPLVATLQLGSEQRNGCAWRDSDDLGPQP
ncbi:MAG: hypothetical protein KDE15_04775 [Erythrobacter sp.]|nr:hypothetical protein [Erythrobacter sp.]